MSIITGFIIKRVENYVAMNKLCSNVKVNLWTFSHKMLKQRKILMSTTLHNVIWIQVCQLYYHHKIFHVLWRSLKRVIIFYYTYALIASTYLTVLTSINIAVLFSIFEILLHPTHYIEKLRDKYCIYFQKSAWKKIFFWWQIRIVSLSYFLKCSLL